MALLASGTLVFLLAGCGGGGGGTEPGSLPAAQSFLPLKVGNQWVYELRKPDTGVTTSQAVADRETVDVTGTTVIDNKEWFVLSSTNWLAATGPDQPLSTTQILMRETNDGVYLYYDVSRIALPWLKTGASSGDTWTESTLGITWTMDGSNDTVTPSADSAAPSGTSYTGCWHVTETDPAGGGLPEEIYERWFKKGVGLVLERFFGQPGNAYDDKVLISYTVTP